MLMGPAMNVLASKAQGQFVTDAVHRHCLTYISSCVEMSPTYKVLKPHLDFILFEVTFPTLCLTEKDLE